MSCKYNTKLEDLICDMEETLPPEELLFSLLNVIDICTGETMVALPYIHLGRCGRKGLDISILNQMFDIQLVTRGTHVDDGTTIYVFNVYGKNRENNFTW